MAVSIPIVSEFINTGIKQAERAFMDIRKQVAQAEGTMGKFKAAGKGVFEAVGANAATFALAAGTAIATFAVKGVAAFQNLAIASGKFADSTGLAVDQASRWIEVAGDVGIDAGTIESAIGKMNKELGKSPDKFRQLGVQLEYTSGGAVDVNETFLNVIDRLNGIKDPAERARVASELLGKGWQSMSELIGQGSDQLRKSLESVSDAKIVDQAELDRARKFRKQMDDMSDSVGDLSMSIGEGLIPVLTALADALLWCVESAKKLQDALEFMPPVLDKVVDMDRVKKQLAMNDAWKEGYGSMIAARDATKYLITGLDDATESTNDLNLAWETLLGQFDKDDAIRNAQRSVEQLQTAAAAAFGDPSKLIDYQEATQDAYEAVARLIEIIGLTNAEQNRIKVLVDTGEIQTAIRLLEIMSKNPGISLTEAMKFRGARANGGPVTAGGTYLVGERGPELLTMGARSGYVTPNHALGSGGPININVNGADPNEVVRALQAYVRQSGPVPVNTRAM